MAKQVTIRRGTTADHSGFAGAEGEITVDTDKDTVVVHDGVTDGGFPLALESSALSDAEIKTAYENNADTNEFSDAEQSKLASIGTIATQDSDAVAITGGSVTGITDLTIADGGTGASDASTARSNLGSTTVGDAVFVATDEEVARAAMLVPNKNAIINGNFDIWQRGTSFNPVDSNDFTADRWGVVSVITAADLTISRQAHTFGQIDVPGEPEFFCRIANVKLADNGFFFNRVEGVRTFAGETVTLSFFAKASAGVTLTSLTLQQNFGSGGSAKVDTALSDAILTMTFQRFTRTVTLPPISDKTIGTGNYLEFSFRIIPNVDIDISSVQLEKGSVATEFERRSQQQELAMAQRYYRETNTVMLPFGLAISTVQIRWLNNWLDNPMRVTPTIGTPATVTARQLDVGNSTFTSTGSISTENFSSKGGSLIQAGYTGLTQSKIFGIFNSIVTYDAEL